MPVPPGEISGLERLGRVRPPRSDRLSIDEAQIKIWQEREQGHLA